MSKKSFKEFYNYYLNNQELYKYIERRKEAMEISWNFCASQYESEIEELKSELERLKKENLAMRNCENCFHFDVLNECNLNSVSCIKLDKWELKK